MNLKKDFGNRGEQIAHNYLKGLSYGILERNLKLGWQELDIIACHEGETVFIEVKTRNIYNLSDNILSRLQTKNLKIAMLKYASIKKINLDNLRLDLILVTVNPQTKTASLRHYINIL